MPSAGKLRGKKIPGFENKYFNYESGYTSFPLWHFFMACTCNPDTQSISKTLIDM